MQPDIFLAAITIVMTVLGGVVSAHAPSGKRHKLLYGLSFVVLGVVAAVLVILQSRQTAKSESDLRNQIAALTANATKVKTLQEDNNQLQQKILELAQANASMARQSLARVTGGDSYCRMEVVEGFQVPNTFIFVNTGNYTLYDVNVQITDVTKIQMKAERHQGISLADNVNLKLGELQPGKAWFDRSFTIPFSGATSQDFNAFFTARNGSWMEKLRLRKIDQHWSSAVQVWFSPLGLKVAAQKPVYEKIDPGFSKDSNGRMDWGK